MNTDAHKDIEKTRRWLSLRERIERIERYQQNVMWPWIGLIRLVFMAFCAVSALAFGLNGQPDVWFPSEGITLAQATNEVLGAVFVIGGVIATFFTDTRPRVVKLKVGENTEYTIKFRD